MLFDWLVVGQVLPFNPASSVRGPKHVVKRGKTPVLSAKETRALLGDIDITNLVGLRDRAFLRVLVYSFARVTAAGPSSGAASPGGAMCSRSEGCRAWVRSG